MPRDFEEIWKQIQDTDFVEKASKESGWLQRALTSPLLQKIALPRMVRDGQSVKEIMEDSFPGLKYKIIHPKPPKKANSCFLCNKPRYWLFVFESSTTPYLELYPFCEYHANEIEARHFFPELAKEEINNGGI